MFMALSFWCHVLKTEKFTGQNKVILVLGRSTGAHHKDCTIFNTAFTSKLAHRPRKMFATKIFNITTGYRILPLTRLVIRTSRTVGSAKKFVRMTSCFDGGEFTKTLRKVCTCQKLKFAFLLLEYCKIREFYAVANAFTIRNMYCLLLYMKCSSRKINRPTENMTKIVTLLHF